MSILSSSSSVGFERKKDAGEIDGSECTENKSRVERETEREREAVGWAEMRGIRRVGGKGEETMSQRNFHRKYFQTFSLFKKYLQTMSRGSGWRFCSKIIQSLARSLADTIIAS
jgi:hypothetical protein